MSFVEALLRLIEVAAASAPPGWGDDGVYDMSLLPEPTENWPLP